MPGGLGRQLRVAFVGEGPLLDAHAPTAANSSAADVTVIFDPHSFSVEEVESLPGITLGVLTGGLPHGGALGGAEAVDRLVCFDPALTGTRVGHAEIWRAIPPPVSDGFFAPARRSHAAPRAMSVGRSTEHREAMLMPAKHHHDLLQVCHGVSGAALVELCAEYDVGVYVARQWGPSFGWQAAMHLAAGHLLLAERLDPAHGLECGIDYLPIDSPDDLVHRLDRLLRFPEMAWSVRVRGRRKAEHFRASAMFARIAHDVLLDVAAFGSSRPARSEHDGVAA